MMKTILLINGPWNGHCIQDIGTGTIRMAVYVGGEAVPGALMGEAIYEPERDVAGEEKAFWLENRWLGQIDEIIGE